MATTTYEARHQRRLRRGARPLYSTFVVVRVLNAIHAAQKLVELFLGFLVFGLRFLHTRIVHQ